MKSKLVAVLMLLMLFAGIILSLANANDTHDISMISVTPNTSHQYPGRMVNITVVVKNNGTVSESFNVTAFRNDTQIGKILVTNLDAGNDTTLIFQWDTTGLTPCQNWTIKAEADSVEGEINTANNNITDGTVKIVMLGDVNGDGVINLSDLINAAAAFGTQPSSLAWNSLADIYPDGIINISDFVKIAHRFGQHCE